MRWKMSRRVLITGASGRIGTKIIGPLHQSFDLVLADIDLSKVKEWEDKGCKLKELNLLSLKSCKNACEKIDTVIHLAGNPSPKASFEELRETNIQGTYNLYSAAKEMGVKRVIFASSIHAIKGYPEDQQVKTDMPVRPLDLYGVSKVFGEGLANYFAYQEGVESIAIRIGGFNSIEKIKKRGESVTARQMSTYLSPKDMAHLIERCILAELQRPFEIVHGISNNQFKFMDLSDTRSKVGYQPQDDGFYECQIIFEEGSE